MSLVVNQLSKSTKSYNSYDASPTEQYTATTQQTTIPDYG